MLQITISWDGNQPGLQGAAVRATIGEPEQEEASGL